MPLDIRLLIMPLPDFALLPFGAFLDKLRFSADDEDYSQQRYCSWMVAGLSLEPVPSSSGAVLQVEAIADQLDLDLFDYLVVFGGRSAMATAALAPRYQALLRQAAKAGVKLVGSTMAPSCWLPAACCRGTKWWCTGVTKPSFVLRFRSCSCCASSCTASMATASRAPVAPPP